MFFKPEYIPDEDELNRASMIIGESNVGKMLWKKAQNAEESGEEDKAEYLYTLAVQYGSDEAEYKLEETTSPAKD